MSQIQFEDKDITVHIDNVQTTSSEMAAPYDSGKQAAQAVEFEHKLSVKEAFRIYRKAVFWCFIVALTIVMDGYDGALVSGFYAQPAFQQRYGERLPDGSYEVPARWQTALGMGAPIGRVIGGLGVGYFASRFGRKLTLIGALVAISGVLFIVFFANGIGMLCAGLILSGIMWGVFNTLAPTYASEVCPLQLRGILTAYINLSWVIGQLIVQGVLNGFSGNKTQWAYRIPFAIQWAWPAVILAILPFAPESPWWLIRKDRVEDARKSLEKLTSFDQPEHLENHLNMIIETDRIERELDSKVSWKDCFRGINLRRTEIACMAWSCQVFSGNSVFGYAAYFFETAGMNSSNAFKLALGMSAIGFVGTVMSWFLTFRFGRRANYMGGLTTIAALMLLMAILDIPKKGDRYTSFAWAQSVIMLILVLIYDLTVGPVAYVIVSEVSAIRLREKTVALATTAYSLWGVVFQVATPYMLNPTAANWSGKVGFLFCGLSLLAFAWTYFRLPEMSHRTYSEIDHMFSMRLSARKFKKFRFSD